MTNLVTLSGYTGEGLTATPALTDGDIIEVDELDVFGNTVLVNPDGTYEWILSSPDSKTGHFRWRVSDDGGSTWSVWVWVDGEAGKAVIFNNTNNRIPLFDNLYNEYPWSPIEEADVIPVGTVAGLVSAVENASDGDVIEIVWPGVYTLPNTLVAAVPNLTIRGSADAVPTDIIIRGRGMTQQTTAVPHGIYSQQPGLYIKNLTLEQFYQHAITFGSGASNPIFEDLILQDCGQQFIKASVWPSAIDNGQVLGCVFQFTAGRPIQDQGSGYFYSGFIDVHRGGNWVVRGNTAREITPTQAEIDSIGAAPYNPWSPAFYFWNGSSNTIIERNVFHNCARSVSLGLIDRLTASGFNDHTGGIVRNNLIAIDSGRLSAAQIADSDSPINLWDCPGGEALHNTILTNGQMNDAIQGRWSLGLEISSNLTDNSIRMRDGATYSGSNNSLDAIPSWFVDPATANLRLSATGFSAVGSATRLPDCLYDVDGVLRNSPTKIGAHVNG